MRRTCRADAPRTSAHIGNDNADRTAGMEEVLDRLQLADCRHVGSRSEPTDSQIRLGSNLVAWSGPIDSGPIQPDGMRKTLRRLRKVSMKIGEAQPCIDAGICATSRQFADANPSLGKDSSKYVWADSALRDNFAWENRYKLVMAVIRHGRLPEHSNALGMLGAGPLEDMISDWLLDRLEAQLPYGDPLRCALSMVGMEFEPGVLRKRRKWMLTA
jgi:hypothetical protein